MEWKNFLTGVLISATVHAVAIYSLSNVALNFHQKEMEKYVKISLKYFQIEKEKGKKVSKKKKDKVYKAEKNKISQKSTKTSKLHKKTEKLKRKKKVFRKNTKKKAKVIAKKTVKKENKPIENPVNTEKQSTTMQKVNVPSYIASKNTKKNIAKYVSLHNSKSNNDTKKDSNKVKNTNLISYAGHISYEKVFVKENLEKIRKYIMENIKYPYIARKMGWQGKVIVEIVLSGKGCEHIKLVKSSGYRILDKNALETVSKVCGKFPKPQRKVSVKVPISYRLR